MTDENTTESEKTTLTVINEQEVLGKDFKVYGTFEEPMFLAKDVAEWIDYSKTSKGSYKVSQMLASVDEDEKLISLVYVQTECDDYIVDTTSKARKTQDMWFLTENGLYEVLMQSRKPIAKQFKKEVKKILHDLRVGNANLINKQDSEKLLAAVVQNITMLSKLITDNSAKLESVTVSLQETNNKVEQNAKAIDANSIDVAMARSDAKHSLMQSNENLKRIEACEKVAEENVAFRGAVSAVYAENRKQTDDMQSRIAGLENALTRCNIPYIPRSQEVQLENDVLQAVNQYIKRHNVDKKDAWKVFYNNFEKVTNIDVRKESRTHGFKRIFDYIEYIGKLDIFKNVVINA